MVRFSWLGVMGQSDQSEEQKNAYPVSSVQSCRCSGWQWKWSFFGSNETLASHRSLEDQSPCAKSSSSNLPRRFHPRTQTHNHSSSASYQGQKPAYQPFRPYSFNQEPCIPIAKCQVNRFDNWLDFELRPLQITTRVSVYMFIYNPDLVKGELNEPQFQLPPPASHGHNWLITGQQLFFKLRA